MRFHIIKRVRCHQFNESRTRAGHVTTPTVVRMRGGHVQMDGIIRIAFNHDRPINECHAIARTI